MLPWQQLLPDTTQNLISARPSWGKHTLKFGENLCMGLSCATPKSFMPTAVATTAWTAQGTTLWAAIKNTHKSLSFGPTPPKI